jgi:hypothetical protein
MLMTLSVDRRSGYDRPPVLSLTASKRLLAILEQCSGFDPKRKFNRQLL